MATAWALTGVASMGGQDWDELKWWFTLARSLAQAIYVHVSSWYSVFYCFLSNSFDKNLKFFLEFFNELFDSYVGTNFQ